MPKHQSFQATADEFYTSFSGLCQGNFLTFGCSIRIRGRDEKNNLCKATGPEIWDAYQGIKKMAECGKCGTKRLGNGCMVSSDYYGSCPYRDDIKEGP
jgi:hypothetical protein